MYKHLFYINNFDSLIGNHHRSMFSYKICQVEKHTGSQMVGVIGLRNDFPVGSEMTNEKVRVAKYPVTD